MVDGGWWMMDGGWWIVDGSWWLVSDGRCVVTLADAYSVVILWGGFCVVLRK